MKMKIHWRLALLTLIFLLGMAARDLYASSAEPLGYTTERTMPTITQQLVRLPSQGITERPSPSDWIAEERIKVSPTKVEIDLTGLQRPIQWATFTDTNSMDPVIDAGANAIEFVPRNEDDIGQGDIVSYLSAYAQGPVIHRVVEKGTDEEGTYYILKGDNNPQPDPGKVRFSQIQRVVLAIIY
ncbi:MAG: hypothetical protein HC945_02475 [Nitrosarchaeum sp.]|nr:hypothetical protein [Nitrosarchaeum sp.]